ncbi:hypothetical protein KI387_035521, partial [Taxus chinensis]
MHIVSWNCRGYPWRRGPGLGPIVEGKDIIILMETHEHEGCKVPKFEGYKKISVWNEGNETGKGHGGITVLIKEIWLETVKVEKEDPNKQYIWLKITYGKTTIRVAACYFTPKGSKTYKRRKLDSEDPYASIKKDIYVFSTSGEIILLGDFNARTANNQSLQLSNLRRRKAFDTEPRDKLWNMMEELGIPDEFRVAVHRLEVHFWYLHPEDVQDTTLIDAYKGLLSSEEYAQVLQMDGKQIQKQALLARVLVVWPCDTSYGNEWKLPPLCFNIAHTSSLICCGVTTNSSVGIDVEEKLRRTSTNVLAFANRWFSSTEIAWLDASTDPEEQRKKFIQLWTLKEAYVKALGRGISGAPLKDFSIYIEHLPIIKERIEHHDNTGSDSVVHKIKLEVLKSGAMITNWQFLLFQPTDVHYASVCMEQDEKQLH